MRRSTRGVLKPLALSPRGGRFLSMGPPLAQRALRFSATGGTAEVWRKMIALGMRPGMINMGQGFPDFQGSEVARRAAREALDDKTVNQYSPQSGSEELRREISSFYSRRHGTTLDAASEIVVTSSGQEALAASFLALLDPGDEVLMFEPFYPFLVGAIRMAGGIPRAVPLIAPEFAIDAPAVEAAITSKTRMIVHNTPHNPTGHVTTPIEMEALAAVCVKHNLVAVSDEVYEHAVFPPLQHQRLADLPGMRERTVTISSAGKLFSLTGWRVAWAYGPARLMAPLNYAHIHMTYCAPTPLQAGIAAALREEDGTFGGVSELFKGNYHLLSDAVLRGTGATPCRAQGGYFLVADVSGSGAKSDMEYCELLADSKGVVCTPLSVFYLEAERSTLVRFTICKSREYTLRACEALLKGV